MSPKELARVVTACDTCVIPWATSPRTALEEADKLGWFIDWFYGVVVSMPLSVWVWDSGRTTDTAVNELKHRNIFIRWSRVRHQPNRGDAHAAYARTLTGLHPFYPFPYILLVPSHWIRVEIRTRIWM